MFPLYDTNPHHRTPWFTLLIILINVGVMLWLSQQPDQQVNRIYATHGFVPKRIEQLADPKVVVEVNLNPQAPHAQHLQNVPQQQIVKLPADRGAIYQSMLTMMFLHGGWLHLLGNMWFLWIFGNNIEDRLGHIIFLCFYILGGLIALSVHWLTTPDSTIPVIGASGAVAAVLGAYAVTYPKAKVRTLVFLFIFITVVDLPALLLLGLWFASQLFAAVGAGMGGMDGGVAWWAHVGGFVAGMLLMPLLALGAPPPDQDWRTEAESQFGALR